MMRRLFSRRAMIWRLEAGTAPGTSTDGLGWPVISSHRRLDLLARQHPPVERIDEDGRAVVTHRAHKEVAREGDTFEPQPRPPGHRHQDDGQADGDTGAPIEHVVEEAVAGVVVLRDVAAKAEVPVEQIQDGGERHATPARGRGAGRSSPAATAPRAQLDPAEPRSGPRPGREIRPLRSAALPAPDPAACLAYAADARRARGLLTLT